MSDKQQTKLSKLQKRIVIELNLDPIKTKTLSKKLATYFNQIKTWEEKHQKIGTAIKIEKNQPVFNDKKWIEQIKHKQQSDSFRSSLSRSIKRLQKRGLIEKNQYKQTIFLTNDGYELKQETVNLDIKKRVNYDNKTTR